VSAPDLTQATRVFNATFASTPGSFADKQVAAFDAVTALGGELGEGYLRLACDLVQAKEAEVAAAFARFEVLRESRRVGRAA